MIVLETPRLLLRHYVPSDVDALSEVLCDRENMRYYPNPFARADVEAWIEKNLRRYQEHSIGRWALVLKADGNFAGDCGLVHQQVDGVTEVEVGYALRATTEDRVWQPRPPVRVSICFLQFRTPACHLPDPSGEPALPPRSRAQRNVG